MHDVSVPDPTCTAGHSKQKKKSCKVSSNSPDSPRARNSGLHQIPVASGKGPPPNRQAVAHSAVLPAATPRWALQGPGLPAPSLRCSSKAEQAPQRAGSGRVGVRLASPVLRFLWSASAMSTFPCLPGLNRNFS